ncbi:hypothetical protein ACGFNP_43025 [Nonomuraea sp. NPDC049269]|uniref:hypothetical protein n=1 Tax=Nonomuraea sp. NPDC049269 TaxID=3364349 RepID=UPI00371022A5
MKILIARATLRMERLARPSNVGHGLIRSTVAPLPIVDIWLRKLGADKDRPPISYGETWADHLAWGVSSIISITRFIYAGQYVGAALLARTQLERWTGNLAFNASLDQYPGESTAAFIGRVWAAEANLRVSDRERMGSAIKDLPAPSSEIRTTTCLDMGTRENDPRYLRTTTTLPKDIAQMMHHLGQESEAEQSIDAHAIYVTLSELLHARGNMTEVAHWESCELLDPYERPEPELIILQQTLADALTLIISRLKAGVASLLAERGQYESAASVVSLPPRFPAGHNASAEPALWPLLPSTGLQEDLVAELISTSRAYEAVTQGKRPIGRLFRDDELLDIMFISHRAQSAQLAVAFFEEERQRFGSAFSFGPIDDRSVYMTTVTEACSLISAWSKGTPLGDAASVAATALRSAFWLWLEDDDRAMALLRIALEQIARMRAWRTKPDASRRLEESPKTTPRDWLEAASLRRLSALNRAVGEFAHVRTGSRWLGARDLIIDLQPRPEGEEAEVQTGRGMALAGVTQLLAREVALAAETHSIAIAAAFRVALGYDSDSEREIDEWLEHIWSRRSSSLGESTFGGPAVERARARKSQTS